MKDLTPLTKESLRVAIASLAKDTGLGFDRISPGFLLDLSEDSMHDLVAIVNEVERNMELLASLQVVLVHLLDKTTTEDRPISLLPMLYRVIVKARSSMISGWGACTAGDWDFTTAKNGGCMGSIQKRGAHRDGQVPGEEGGDDLGRLHEVLRHSGARPARRLGPRPGLSTTSAGHGGQHVHRTEDGQEAWHCGRRAAAMEQHGGRVWAGSLPCQGTALSAPAWCHRRVPIEQVQAVCRRHPHQESRPNRPRGGK